jgi:hypothetical protein
MRFKIPAKQPAAFRSSAMYLAGRTKGLSPDRVDWMEARNLETEDPQAAAAVMDATAAQNVRCKKPVYHFVLSFDPKDAKRGKVPPEVMRGIAGEAVDRLGLNEHQMLIYAHKDTDHPHMHFLVNRIHPQTGKAFDRHNDGRRLAGLCREIARERGLNIPRERERIRERVDDFDLVESLKKQSEQPAPERIPEGEYWQAKKEERAPQVAMDKADVKNLREKIQGHFFNASDWQDLTARLGAQGVYLERKGQGLILARGDAYAKLSQMGKGVRLGDLEDRFGERFDAYMARQLRERAPFEVPAANIPGYEAMTPAERRRAENLFNARKAVERKKGDPVLELDAAEQDFRYWSGVQANYRATERNVARQEKEKAWLKKVEPNFEKREQKARYGFLEFMGRVYRDADKAEARWEKLEKDYGVEDAWQMVRDNPTLLGRMQGRGPLIQDSAKRAKAKEAIRSLDIWQARKQKSVLESLKPIFRDPVAAQKKWRKLEKEHGVKLADRLIRDNPGQIGRLHGRGSIGKDSAERVKAKRAFRYLDARRKRWRQTVLKLGHHRDRIEANRRALRIALNDFEMMKLRSDVPFELQAILKDRITRRQRALARVTERAILESDFAEDRKMELLRAKRIYRERKRELERSRELGLQR